MSAIRININAIKMIFVVMLLFMIAGLVVGQDDPIETPDTSLFRGDLAHTGVYETTGPRETPALRWQFEVSRPVRTSIAVANGIAYTGSEAAGRCLRLTYKRANSFGNLTHADRSFLPRL